MPYVRNGGWLRLVFVALLATGTASCIEQLTMVELPPDPPREPDGSAANDAGPHVQDGAAIEPSGPTPPTYANPVFTGDFPDPFVLRQEGRYYAFSTNAAGKNIRALMSTDLASWEELPDALPVLPEWAKENASLTWAPSVLERRGTFVLYYTARSIASGFQCIGRAVSTTAEGPYVDDSAGPFICQVDGAQPLCGSIDPSPFVDENGDAYLLWKSDENAPACSTDSRIWIQRLGVDGLSLLGTPIELLRRDSPWETPLVEGPSMVKANDRYWLFYSANWWESSSYGIGYAICATPIGPCEKKTTDGPLVQSTGEVLGPGGQEFFTDVAGKTWMAYHAWTSPVVGYSNGGSRSLRIDPIVFSGDVPTVAGPTTTESPL